MIRVLADVSLELDAGETVAVLAQRAQGKTSLLRVAAGIERPDRGHVCFEGEDLWELLRAAALAAAGRADRLGRSGGAGSRHADARQRRAAAVCDLRKERGLRAGDGSARAGGRARSAREQFWGSLADWERALVAIAQGIAREPKLLLVDDLTLSLGLAETDEITRLLDTLAIEQGFAVLMSVSDAVATGWSGRVATLSGGELLETPRPPARLGNIIDFPGAGPGVVIPDATFS